LRARLLAEAKQVLKSIKEKFVGLVAAVALIASVASLYACADHSPISADGAVILDVRTPEEFATGHVEGAININYRAGDFEKRVAELDRDTRYVVYCRSGNRSGKSIQIMEKVGFKNLQNAGGVQDAGKRLGLPIVK